MSLKNTSRYSAGQGLTCNYSIACLALGLDLGLWLDFGLCLGLGFYVTNSDSRVTVGDRVIFTNHIPVLAEGLRN